MAFTTLSLGLTLTIPTNGTRNWGTTLFNTTWTKISNHNHTGSGDGNQMVTASYSDQSITPAKIIKNFPMSIAPTVTPLGTAQTLDFNLGMNQQINLASATGTVILTLTNPTAGSYSIKLVQGATFRDITWPASIKWPQGQIPILTQTASAIDYIWLYYDGTNYFGIWELTFS